MPRDTNYLPKAEFTRRRNSWPSGETLLERIGYFGRPQPNGCIFWESSHNEAGRPTIKVGTQTWIVYRLTWIWHNGRVPKGKILRHVKCGDRRCINHEHIEPGTHFENARDRDRDETTMRGEAHYKAVLTETQVKDILLYHESHRAAARRYGVGMTTISKIRSGEIWKHVPRPVKLAT
jgi:hypothetical protein